MSAASGEPTDLELMMLLDGELDGERRAEVEAFLAEAGEDEGAAVRGKLGGLRAVSAVVSGLDWPTVAAARAIDVADQVMAALPAEHVEEAVVAEKALPVVGAGGDAKPITTPGKAKKAASETPAAPPSLAVSSRAPANDNSRTIFGVAIAAAAAAAALFFWGKADDDAKVGSPDPIAMTAPPPGTEVLGDVPAPLGVVADGEEPAKGEPTDDLRYGVEVASVDFGARSGAIYYVPAADLEGAAGKAAVTTVVWLNDD